MKLSLQLSLTALLSAGLGVFAIVNAQTPAAHSLAPEDYNEIQQLYARYNIAIDAGNAEEWAGTFLNEGTFNNFRGYAALVEFANNWHNKMKGANLRHWNTNLSLAASPDGATGFVYLMLVDISSRPPAISSLAKYEDQLVKTPQGWRFSKRVTKPDAAASPPSESH